MKTNKPKDLYGYTTDKEVKDWIESQYGVKVLFLTVTGSHMWNLATENADLDIRGIFIKPTEQILSIHKGRDTIESCGIMDKDIDIQLYEIEKMFRMILNANGNIIEMLMSPTAFYQEKFIEWKKLAKKSLCRKLANYYKGYATSQRKRATINRGGKSLVYTYREVMAGTWLMRTGKIIYDFTKLKSMFEKYYAFKSTLLDWAMKNKTTPITEEVWEGGFLEDWEKLCRIFDDEESKSILPKTVDNYSEFNELLLKLRACSDNG